MSHDTYQLSPKLRTFEDDEPQVADLLQGLKKAMGMVPNMYAAMANLPALLETYSFGYERFFPEDVGLRRRRTFWANLMLKGRRSLTSARYSSITRDETMGKLDGAIAIINGAASGIGEATARLLAAEIRLNPIQGIGSSPAQAI